MKGRLIVPALTASVLLAGCGSTHRTAQSKASCSAGKTLIAGHFHFRECVPSATARVAFVCAETQYELIIIFEHARGGGSFDGAKDQQEALARESAGVLARAAVDLRATGENAKAELSALARHHLALLNYGAEVRRARDFSALDPLLERLGEIDQGCFSPVGDQAQHT